MRYLYISLACLMVAACSLLGTAPTMQDDPFKAADQNLGALTDKEQNLLRLARSTHAGGDDAAAIKLYRDAIAQSKGSIRAHLELADLYSKQKNYEDAVGTLRAAEKLQPKNADVERMIGNTYLAANAPGVALDAFNKAVALAPKDGRAYSSKGVALDSLGKHDEAQKAYREGLKVTPKDNAYLTNNLALSLILDGKYDEAITLLEPLVAADGATPTMRQNLALAYGFAGKKDKALAMGLKDLSKKEAEENLRFYSRYVAEAPATKAKPTNIPVKKAEPSSPPKPSADAKTKKDKLLKPEPAKAPAKKPQKEEPKKAAPAPTVSSTPPASPEPEPAKPAPAAPAPAPTQKPKPPFIVAPTPDVPNY